LVIVLAANLGMVRSAYGFIGNDGEAARRVMFSSYIYLPWCCWHCWQIKLREPIDLTWTCERTTKENTSHKFTLWVALGSIIMMFAG